MPVLLRLTLLGTLMCGLCRVDERASDELPAPDRCYAENPAPPFYPAASVLELGLHLGRGEQIAREDGPPSRLLEEILAARTIAMQHPELRIDRIDAILAGFKEASVNNIPDPSIYALGRIS